MKKILSVLCLVMVLCASVILTGCGETLSEDTQVFITETGECYHLPDCDVDAEVKVDMTVAEAKEKGYKPCKKCIK